MDLCSLLGVPTPGSTTGEYVFEQDTLVLGAARGYADVFLRNHFAWENKTPGANLDLALKQLLGYSLALDNPPLLVVCDRQKIRIHTQFNGHPSEVHTVTLEELAQPEKQQVLRRLWTDPESFRPKVTSRDITEEAAKSFATLAEGMRQRGSSADSVAHFLTQCLFCFFAEDVSLLPGRMFERLLNNKKLVSKQLTSGLDALFKAMRSGGMFGADEIPWFNGGLFKKISVPELTILDITQLRSAAALNWSAIDVSIFGTLFERGLDPAKRSQLGAHYTDPATIMRIVDPVLRRPLVESWETAAAEIKTLMDRSKSKKDNSHRAAVRRFIGWLDQLQKFRILDPACGSGNFLFIGLKVLKDVEHKSHLDAVSMGLDREQDLVTGPYNVVGIELNEFAAELARVTVWIGELQWRLQHGYPFKTNPVLEPLDNIECRDALMATAPNIETGKEGFVEAKWPRATVVIGNPPFLGGSKKRSELGAAYFEGLKQVFEDRVPAGADLVCYWFDKALRATEKDDLRAAGLVTTNSIRGGANRKVLEAVVDRSKIFEAWSDEAWINEGASVRVSLVAIGASPQSTLNGKPVEAINADLTSLEDVDLTAAVKLRENSATAFLGMKKGGKFDIDGDIARAWLQEPNPHGKSNADVLRPWTNGTDIVQGRHDKWIIDFGATMLESDASLYQAPIAHVLAYVKPVRDVNNREVRKKFWWRFSEPMPALRRATQKLDRFIVTPRVSKHRIFAWRDVITVPDDGIGVTLRADDTTFGILHSRFHEVWSLRMCTWLGVGNDPRYTPTTCFETFAFPQGLTPLETAGQLTEHLSDGERIPAGLEPGVIREAVAIAKAAKRLDDLRSGWASPKEWITKVAEPVPIGLDHSPFPERIVPKPGFATQLSARTLTKLYNERPAWLDAAHRALDAAVAESYGWGDYTPEMSEEEILRRLVTLNRQRSAGRT